MSIGDEGNASNGLVVIANESCRAAARRYHLAVTSHGIPTRIRETELKIRHPGGFWASRTCERRAHGVALRCAPDRSRWSRFANAIRALASPQKRVGQREEFPRSGPPQSIILGNVLVLLNTKKRVPASKRP